MKDSSSTLFKDYYYLTKPGIIRGNAVSAIAGFLLASRGHVQLDLFLAMLCGLSLVIASACVFNNFIDRDIDRQMDRTKKRALVRGTISGRAALAYASILGLAGLTLLAFRTNLLTAQIALFGHVMYVIVYGFWKRRSTLGTLIGSISGAVPPVIGYSAVSNRIDMAAAALFLILVFWQMPHFFAIALYRTKDYAAANIPVLPVKKGARTTKIQMLLYTIGFSLSSLFLGVAGYTGRTYLLIASLISVVWLVLGVRGFSTTNDVRWGRQMFIYSLIALTLLCATISVDYSLP